MLVLRLPRFFPHRIGEWKNDVIKRKTRWLHLVVLILSFLVCPETNPTIDQYEPILPDNPEAIWNIRLQRVFIIRCKTGFFSSWYFWILYDFWLQNENIDVYGDDVEVDYRGYEVTVENFVRLLTGRLPENTPRSKRLLTDAGSNILIYMTGMGFPKWCF